MVLWFHICMGAGSGGGGGGGGGTGGTMKWYQHLQVINNTNHDSL